VRLTIRLEEDELFACDDHGQSRSLDPALAAQLTAAWDASPTVEPVDGRSALVLADLGQARVVQPQPSGSSPSAHPLLPGERRPLGPLSTALSAALADVLDRRRSGRGFGPATLGQVAILLMRGARVRDWTTAEDGYQVTHRPAPSAGARQPFDLHLIVGQQVHGLDAGEYLFDAVAGALVAAIPSRDSVDALLARVGEQLGASSPPPGAIFLVAYLDRTLSRYPAGMSLVWRDAGVLLQTLHLCATDLQLNSCIAGTCGLLCDNDAGATIDMGCLAFGGPPDPDSATSFERR
jgi:SagB-type dehydrogenase family enzyme